MTRKRGETWWKTGAGARPTAEAYRKAYVEAGGRTDAPV
jgi:hypothetical protein